MSKTCIRCAATHRRRGTPFCIRCAMARWRDPTMLAAHHAVTTAVRRGEIPPARELACVDCGKPAFDYDHREYAKPLQVDPVCRSCHRLRGPAIDSIHAPAASDQAEPAATEQGA